MLNSNNSEDLNQMMNYHRTKDMLNLKIYFKSLSPIKNIVIVKSLEDYYSNFELLKNLPEYRNDSPINNPVMKTVNGKNIEEIFKQIKEIDENGVLVLFDLCHKPSKRYERYAGISVGISVDNGIYIDAVGKGFDGREVSKGISVHERYFIPWYSIRVCSINNFKQYQTYLINQKDYEISREERINYLKNLNYDIQILENQIPKIYEPIPDFIWMDIIRNIIKKVESMDEELKSAGLEECALSGHTEGKQFLPWQIFDKSRYLTKR